MRTTRAEQKALERLSPFELKEKLLALAEQSARRTTRQMLNAGRGNPNWIATTPRDAFFTLGRFAIEEAERAARQSGRAAPKSDRSSRAPGLGGLPAKRGIARRFAAFLSGNARAPGAVLLRDALRYGVKVQGFDADDWVQELADGVLGNHYPEPGRMLRHIDAIVHAYFVQELCAGKPPRGRYELFATEGGTAAMCYIFDSLLENGLLQPGGRIALAVPTFTPYVEIPRLERYGFEVVQIRASEMRADGSHAWQYPDAELDRLADRSIKALFVVNPSNPPSVAIRARSMRRIVRLVKTENPGLMIITDDVYATFVPGFRSLLAELPHNTIGVYSFSKYFGCTGWRLGVIALHSENVFDAKIAALPAARRKALARRYASLSLHPEQMKFVDRMLADSRQVALNHTAGLSLPQQVQMGLFALSALLDARGIYRQLTREILRRRLQALWHGLGLELPEDPTRAGYYCELDLMVWARQHYGADFAGFLVRHYEPADIVFRLAEQSSIVLMHGAGFAGPEWSLRVSLANLPEAAYGRIGAQLKAAAQAYVRAWRASRPARGRR